MTKAPLILAIDQGTTSSRAIVYTVDGMPIAIAQQEIRQIYPQEGWVEHDPEQIWSTCLAVVRDVIQQVEPGYGEVVAIGITNHRETTLVWERASGKPIYNAIVWQDCRTADYCDALKTQGHESLVREKTGLLLDPYFSASKLRWILQHVDGAEQRAAAGDLVFGTVDSFLLNRLTAGKVHATDVTNASRTNLFNIQSLNWDPQLLELFSVPAAVLPEVKPCTTEFGYTDPALLGRAIPILGMIGDQQAAAVGQACFQPGEIKSTYGTGCFVLANTGTDIRQSQHRLLTTVAYQLGDTTHYALEGSIFMAGATVQWLRDELGMIKSAAESEQLAASLDGNNGVYLVPGFTGLGAPHWVPNARAAIFGMTRATGRAEFARAALESVCYQTSDLLQAIRDDGIAGTRLRVDGGMAANNWLLQFLADITGAEVDKPINLETTALGAAYTAGLQAGIYSGTDAIREHWRCAQNFRPHMPKAQQQKLLSGWRRAVAQTIAY